MPHNTKILFLAVGEHMHRCTKCKHIWKHDPAELLGIKDAVKEDATSTDILMGLLNLILSGDKFEQSHICEHCKTETTDRYDPQIDGYPEGEPNDQTRTELQPKLSREDRRRGATGYDCRRP